jgi:DNA adenine methylase
MNPSTSLTVKPVSPAAPYIGGKRNLAPKLVPIIDRIDADGYAEPFVGMGGIFLRRRRRARVEVINDYSGDVATFFRVLQEHYEYLVDTLRFRVSSRAEFARLIATRPEHLTDLRRAARFLYLQRLAFGGKVDGRNFGVSSTTPSRFNVAKIEPMLADIHERLADVTIEQLDFGDFIRRYDRAGMLFYLDPPYFGSEDDYGKEAFSRADFDRLAAQLASIKGRFILSINDTPTVRHIFAAFRWTEVRTIYTLARKAANDVGELVISNFELPA